MAVDAVDGITALLIDEPFELPPDLLSNLCGPTANFVPFVSCALLIPLGGFGTLSTYASLVVRTK